MEEETVNLEGWVVREGQEERRSQRGNQSQHSGSSSGDWNRTVNQKGGGGEERSTEQLKAILMKMAGMETGKMEEVLEQVGQGAWTPVTSDRQRKRKERTSPNPESPTISSPEQKKQNKDKRGKNVIKLSNQFEALSSSKVMADLVALIGETGQVGGE